MTRPAMEASVREARTNVLAIWNLSTDREVRRLADEAYRKLSEILRAWDVTPTTSGTP